MNLSRGLLVERDPLHWGIKHCPEEEEEEFLGYSHHSPRKGRRRSGNNAHRTLERRIVSYSN